LSIHECTITNIAKKIQHAVDLITNYSDPTFLACKWNNGLLWAITSKYIYEQNAVVMLFLCRLVLSVFLNKVCNQHWHRLLRHSMRFLPGVYVYTSFIYNNCFNLKLIPIFTCKNNIWTFGNVTYCYKIAFLKKSYRSIYLSLTIQLQTRTCDMDILWWLRYTFFSSPEHKVLRVSYCDRSLSVVRRRPSCVVRCASSVNFFT